MRLKLHKYRNPKSGVDAYKLGEDFIIVRFKDGDTYLYNYQKPGKNAVETMKKLAKQDRGLNTFISQHVRADYAAKL